MKYTYHLSVVYTSHQESSVIDVIYVLFKLVCLTNWNQNQVYWNIQLSQFLHHSHANAIHGLAHSNIDISTGH